MNIREEKTELVLYSMFEQYEKYCDELQELPFYEQMEHSEESYFYQEMMNYFYSRILEENVADRLLSMKHSLKKLFLIWRKNYGKQNDALILEFMKTTVPAIYIPDWRG